MHRFALISLLLASAVFCMPIDDEEAEKELEAAKNAKYHFGSEVQDGISDLSQQREEVRDGQKVTGFYSYSDGHHKHKISYEADENGYRVVSTEIEPLAGPVVNPEGIANVHTFAHGSEITYSVEGDDKTRHGKKKSEKLNN